MAQQDHGHLCSTRSQVRSLARHSGVRIQHCCSRGVGRSCGSDLTPGPGTPDATRPSKKKIKERKEKYMRDTHI